MPVYLNDHLVQLIDDSGKPSGTALKSRVHHDQTPLHLAFSCHVVDRQGRVLITRRSINKQTFAGVWSNAFCGHPQPGQDMEEAVRLRANHELGMSLTGLRLLLPHFRYRATDMAGQVENELCPVFMAVVDSDPSPNQTETDAFTWLPGWQQLTEACRAAPFALSPWLVAHEPLVSAALDQPVGGLTWP